MIYLHVIVSLVLLLGGCKKPADSTSEEKFARLRKLNNERYKYLIKYIHAEKWQIVYGFYGKEKTCSSPVLLKSRGLLPDEEKKKRDAITLQMESNIANALDTWLSPLRKLGLQKRIITKEDFEFKELAPVPTTWKAGVIIHSYTAEHLKKNNLLSTPDLTIAFGCGNEASYFALAGVASEEVFFPKPHQIPPNIFIYQTNIPYKHKRLKNAQRHLLLHEIGHAFGLADTHDVFGQGMAAMNTASKREALSDTLSLDADDIKGIEWLYYYYHNPEKLEGNPCFFTDYEKVKKRTKHWHQTEFYCQHIYPVIHEVKQAYAKEQHGDMVGAKVFIASAIADYLSKEITIGKQDKVGRTALHYAVIYEGESKKLKTDWRRTIKGLLKNGFDKKIMDNKGKTACRYLQCKDNETDVEIGCSEIRSLLCS